MSESRRRQIPCERPALAVSASLAPTNPAWHRTSLVPPKLFKGNTIRRQTVGQFGGLEGRGVVPLQQRCEGRWLQRDTSDHRVVPTRDERHFGR